MQPIEPRTLQLQDIAQADAVFRHMLAQAQEPCQMLSMHLLQLTEYSMMSGGSISPRCTMASPYLQGGEHCLKMHTADRQGWCAP